MNPPATPAHAGALAPYTPGATPLPRGEWWLVAQTVGGRFAPAPWLFPVRLSVEADRVVARRWFLVIDELRVGATGPGGGVEFVRTREQGAGRIVRADWSVTGDTLTIRIRKGVGLDEVSRYERARQ